ncbi:MAG TPA: molybdopterin dinucleotide binding domain-containing protein, partial [Nocardioides sp.]
VTLTTGRVLAQYQSGAQTRRIRDLPDDGPFVELHPMLAGRCGVVDGEPVRLTTRRGSMVAPARVVSTIRPDTVFVPFHWVGANLLTNDALDPASRMPEFKACAVQVSTPTRREFTPQPSPTRREYTSQPPPTRRELTSDTPRRLV